MKISLSQRGTKKITFLSASMKIPLSLHHGWEDKNKFILSTRKYEDFPFTEWGMKIDSFHPSESMNISLSHNGWEEKILISFYQTV